jgi:predicted dehydrogenase/threonine dehydrogenase-like Zn-dependent dehydrogenase
MNQLTQKLKDGKLQVLEVPLPVLQAGQVLIRNHYSLISAGTEGSTVQTARKGLIGKAKERPQQVKQVLEVLRTQGIVQTYRAVMKKLDAYSPLGYSCAGEVLAVGQGVREFSRGDLVAAGGLSACHAEVVAVPVNLCVKLPAGTDLQQAAYNTLGAIALQGVRQADLRLGECAAVIGLGLLGQLTCLLLRAAGVRTIGLDIDPAMVELARQHCADLALLRETPGLAELIADYTHGLGCDAVIITAATSSLDPINFAGAIARKKGVVVIVGNVPTGFDREPHYYKKELAVRMSCSYGPGRYDPTYEEKGLDYPAAYVRWTEKRNMQAFQELLYTGKIDVSYLTTHVFPLEEAPRAYDLLLSKAEPFVGLLVAYDTAKEQTARAVSIQTAKHVPPPDAITIGFIGAGSYAQSHLLPNLPKDPRIICKGVMTATGTGARSVAERFGFEFCTTDEQDILGNEEINTVFIATRHDSHADLVKKALRAGKHVFVEKPLCLHPEELEEIREVYEEMAQQGRAGLLMVGYNRRFAPLVQKIQETLPVGPKAMLYRINAGAIPADSWIQDPDLGGGRIIGEVCHFVDLLTYLAGALPTSVSAVALPDPHHCQDTLSINLSFADGSIGTICYFANGDKSLPKEYLEVYAHGAVAILDDFRFLSIHQSGRKKTHKLLSQDKGQHHEVQAFMKALTSSGMPPIPFLELYQCSNVVFKIMPSLSMQQTVKTSNDRDIAQ